jgi:membrane protease YdiL (CAAX protease family)
MRGETTTGVSTVSAPRPESGNGHELGRWLLLRDALREVGSLEYLYQLAKDGTLRSRHDAYGRVEVWLSVRDRYGPAEPESTTAMAALGVDAAVGTNASEAAQWVAAVLGPLMQSHERQLQLARENGALAERLAAVERELRAQRGLAAPSETVTEEPTEDAATGRPEGDVAPHGPEEEAATGGPEEDVAPRGQKEAAATLSPEKAGRVRPFGWLGRSGAADLTTGGLLAVWGPLAGYLAAITCAELLLALGAPVAGIALHLVLLFLLPVHAAFAPSRQAPLYVALVLAPLLRAVSLALPLAGWDIIYWYLATSLPLFAAIIVAARALGYTRHQLGLRIGNPGAQLGIAVLGIPLGVAEYLILRPRPLIDDLTPESLLVPALILLVSTGLLEEVTFRGVLQVAAIDAVGVAGIAYVSALFAVLHIGHLSGVDVVFVFLVGMVFASLVRRTGSLLGVTLAHGLTNIGLFLVFPLLQHYF